jgi:hypothetical protein
LNRFEDVLVPSFWFELMKTGVPLEEVTPKISPMKQPLFLVRSCDAGADTDNLIGCGNSGARESAQSDVAATGGIVIERLITDSCVAVAANSVVKESR